MSASICEECNDAPATTGAWFNGATWVALCEECYVCWETHSLVEPRSVLGAGTEEET